jgi:hypothetical protein
MFFRPLTHFKKAVARVVSIFVPNLIFDLDAAYFKYVPANNFYTNSSNGSLLFDGVNESLTTPTNSAFTAAGDFTVEGWYYPTNVTGGHSLFCLGSETTDRQVWALSGTSVTSNLFGSGTVTYTSTVAINTWTHIAVVRIGSTVKVYINGTASVTTDTQSGTIGHGIMQICADSGGAATFEGFLSNFRFVNGTGVYTGNFTTPTSPLTATQSSGTNIAAISSGTQLLLNTATSATYITDSSSNNFTITNNNATTWAAATPFSGLSGTYTLTTNAGSSLTWNSANGGTFAKSNNTGTDYIVGGPNYVTGQSYTVFMAYKLSATASGRLLNTQSEASKDWLMGAYNGNPDTFYPNFSVNLPSSGADTAWHFGWATWDTGTSTGKLFKATSVAPTTHSFTATNGAGGGFNQLRLFSRSSGSEVQSGNIAFVKVYNGVLDISTIQSLHATYKARFGY